MQTYVFQHRACRVRRDIKRAVADAGAPGPPCPVCGLPLARVFATAGFIMRPQGYRLRPEDKGYDDFRYEQECGQIRDDATPVTLSPSELAAWDDQPVAVAPDPERDHRLSQLIKQHWTDDLSPGVQYNRDLALKAAQEQPA